MKLKTIAAALVMTFAASGAQAANEAMCNDFQGMVEFVAEYHKEAGVIDSSKLIGSGTSTGEQMMAKEAGHFVEKMAEHEPKMYGYLSAEGVSKIGFTYCMSK